MASLQNLHLLLCLITLLTSCILANGLRCPQIPFHDSLLSIPQLPVAKPSVRDYSTSLVEIHERLYHKLTEFGDLIPRLVFTLAHVTSPSFSFVSLSDEHRAGGDARRAQPVDGARPVVVECAHDRLDGISRRKREGDCRLVHCQHPSFGLPSFCRPSITSTMRSSTAIAS